MAGIPNILGDYYKKGPAGGLYGGDETTANGAFSALYYAKGRIAKSSENNYGQYYVHFDASGSNSTYGSSTTVTPLSESCLICIRY